MSDEAATHEGILAGLLRRAYAAAMFQVPPPPDLGPGIDALRLGAGSLADMLPRVPEQMPAAPEWMQRYMIGRGLVPDERRSGLTPESGSRQP